MMVIATIRFMLVIYTPSSSLLTLSTFLKVLFNIFNIFTLSYAFYFVWAGEFIGEFDVLPNDTLTCGGVWGSISQSSCWRMTYSTYLWPFSISTYSARLDSTRLRFGGFPLGHSINSALLFSYLLGWGSIWAELGRKYNVTTPQAIDWPESDVMDEPYKRLFHTRHI